MSRKATHLDLRLVFFFFSFRSKRFLRTTVNRAHFFFQLVNSEMIGGSCVFPILHVETNMNIMQHLHILNDSHFSSWLLPLKQVQHTGILLALRLLLTAVESPLHCSQLNDSSHMWSMKFLAFTYPPHEHVWRFIYMTNYSLPTNYRLLCASLIWGVMSDARRPHLRQERASWEYTPKNVPREVTHSVACPESPLPLASKWGLHCIQYTEFSCVIPETQIFKYNFTYLFSLITY